ncbi:MAG: hypothetical protein ACRDJM_09270 [Actinomycetota bacterium]
MAGEMMRGAVTTAAAAILLAGLLSAAPASSIEAVGCTGLEVTKRDPTGDGKPLSRGSNFRPDLSGFSVRWSSEGLHVRWSVGGSPDEIVRNAHRVRFMLLGYAGPYGVTRYAFVEGEMLADELNWSRGIGYSGGSSVVGPPEWIDTWKQGGSPEIDGENVSVTFPASRLYLVDGSLDWIRWEGDQAALDDEEHEDFLFGAPTAPAAAIGVPMERGSGNRLWELSDWAPNDRVQGDAVTGYEVDYNQPLRAPELCRPNPPSSYGAPVRCNYNWSIVGPGWFAARINVDAVSRETFISGAMRAILAQGSAVAGGLFSDRGMADLRFLAYGNSGTDAKLGRRTAEIPDAPWPGSGALQLALDLGWPKPIQLPDVGAWWIVALVSRGATASLSYTIEAPGVQCGRFIEGSTVESVPFEEFRSGVGVGANAVPRVGLSTVDHGTTVEAAIPIGATAVRARHDVTARGWLLAILGGDSRSLGAEVVRLSVNSPFQGRQYSRTVRGPIGSSAGFYEGIFEMGRAGRYSFEVDIDLAARAVPTHWPGLLWADVDLP